MWTLFGFRKFPSHCIFARASNFSTIATQTPLEIERRVEDVQSNRSTSHEFQRLAESGKLLWLLGALLSSPRLRLIRIKDALAEHRWLEPSSRRSPSRLPDSREFYSERQLECPALKFFPFSVDIRRHFKEYIPHYKTSDRYCIFNRNFSSFFAARAIFRFSMARVARKNR